MKQEYQAENWLENDINITVDDEPNNVSRQQQNTHFSQDKEHKISWTTK